VKQLENGDLAVAFFNRGDLMTDVTAYWAVLGLEGKHKVRDLWRHVNAGSVKDGYTADVPQHGVVMVRIAR